MKKITGLLAIAILLLTLSFTRRPLTWVAIGDSITYLNDHPNETGNRVREGYLSRVTGKLHNIKYVNQGHNGWTSGRIAQYIDSLGIPSADVYSIFLGTNDWWHSDRIGSWDDYSNHTGNGTVYGSFRIIIDKIRSLNKDAAIVLITPMQRTDFVYIANPKNNAYGSYKEKDGQTLEQVVAAISDIGEHEGLKVIDLYHERRLSAARAVKFKRLRDTLTHEYKDFPYPAYTTIPFHPGDDEYPYPPEAIGITYDGLHPSDKGNAIIAKKLVKVLKKL